MSGTLLAGLINWQCTPSQLEVKPISTGNLLTTREDKALEIGGDAHSKAAEDQKLRDPRKALPYAQKAVEMGGNNKSVRDRYPRPRSFHAWRCGQSD
jgi:hypothetical protein